MVARKNKELIILLAYHTIFHELGASHRNLHTDKHGRCWKKKIDPETNLACFSCKTNQIFPQNPVLEKLVKYI